MLLSVTAGAVPACVGVSLQSYECGGQSGGRLPSAIDHPEKGKPRIVRGVVKSAIGRSGRIRTRDHWFWRPALWPN